MEDNPKYIPLRNDFYLLLMALLCLIIINLSTMLPPLVENIAQFFLIFLLPGYALSHLFFYLKDKFLISQRIILAIFFSLLLIGIWELIVNYTPLTAFLANYELTAFLANNGLTFFLVDYEIMVTLIIFAVLIVRIIHVMIIKRREKRYKISEEKSDHKKSDHQLRETILVKVKEEKDTKTDLDTSKIEFMKVKQSYLDLIGSILLGLISFTLIYLLEETLIQIPVALITIFFLPGYSLLSLLKISFKEKKWYIKIISAALISIIITIGLGLTLNYLNYTLSPRNILLILLFFSLLLLVLAYLRRRIEHKKQIRLIKGRAKVDKPKPSSKIIKDQRSKTLKETRKDYKTLKKTKKLIKDNFQKIKNLNLLLVVLTLLALLFTFLPLNLITYQNQDLLRIMFILPLLIFLPGYSLLRALFYSKIAKIKFNGKVLLIISSIFLSLILTLLGGVLLDLFNQARDMNIIFLSLLTFTGIMIYYIKRKRTSDVSTEAESSKMDYILKEYPELSFLDKDIPELDEDLTDEELDLANNLLRKYKNKFLDPQKRSQKKDEADEAFEEKMEEKLDKAFEPALEVESEKIKKYSFFKKTSDLLIILGLILFTLIFIFLPPLNQTPLRSILGLLFVLFIPGYVLTGALFPKKSDLEGIERLALSFGLSLAITPLIGLALNYTPWGIRLIPIVLSLTLFTFILVFIAILRRWKLEEDEVFHPQFLKHINSLKSGFKQESRLDKILSVVLVITLVVAVSMTIYIVVSPQQGEQFTEFYILGPEGMASDYPTNLTVGETGNLIIGVVNREYELVDYRLEVRLNGTLLNQQNLTLEHEEKWEEEFSFNATSPGANQKLEFFLYKLPDLNEAYRSLHLWVDVS